MTPNDLISTARAMALPYGGTSVFPGVLAAELTQLDKEVVGMYQMDVPQRVSAQATDITVVFASNPTGYGLTYGESYQDLRLVDSGGYETPIRIVSESEFLHPPVHPAGTIRGSTFFPCDPLGRDWDVAGGARQVFIGDGDVIR